MLSGQAIVECQLALLCIYFIIHGCVYVKRLRISILSYKILNFLLNLLVMFV